MTPDELDAVLSDRPDLNPFEEALIAALREAWHERDAYRKAKAENDERFMLERDEARAEVERLREDAATFERMFREAQRQAVNHRERANKAKARAIDAEAALARVRALISDWERLGYGGYLTPQVRAVLDGGDDD